MFVSLHVHAHRARGVPPSPSHDFFTAKPSSHHVHVNQKCPIGLIVTYISSTAFFWQKHHMNQLHCSFTILMYFTDITLFPGLSHV